MLVLESKQERTDKENRQLIFDTYRKRGGGGWGGWLVECSLRDGDKIYCGPDYSFRFDANPVSHLIDPQRDGADMKLEDVIVFDMKGKSLDGKPATELYNPGARYRVPFYTGLYSAYPEYKGVVHTHSMYLAAFCNAGVTYRPLDILSQEYCGSEIPILDHPTFSMGWEGLPDAMTPLVVEGLKERKVCLIRNHGAYAVGANIKEAMNRLELLEMGAQITIFAAVLKSVSQSALPELEREAKEVWEKSHPGGHYGPMTGSPYHGLRHSPKSTTT